MKDSIFRKVSLERLSSPEQVDQLLKITNPAAWLSLTGVHILLFFVLFWSITAQIPVKIEGKGMLIKSEGVFNIQHSTGGVIKEINIKPDDVIKKGDIIAVIDKPDLLYTINENEIKLEKLLTEKEERNKTKEANKPLFDSYYKLKEKSIYSIKNNSSIEYEVRMKELMFERNKMLTNEKQNDKILDDLINETGRFISQLKSDFKSASNVESPYSGKVIEVMINRGELLLEGKTIASIERSSLRNNKDITAVLYVPLSEGKNIKAGMNAFISPSGVKKEDYGYMTGTVDFVSSYPATFQGMMKVFENEAMVSRLSDDGPVITLKINLIESENNHTGYKWSSGRVPLIDIMGGTMCSGTVTVAKKRPISFLLPMFNEQ